MPDTTPLIALLIDPQRCLVGSIQVEPDGIPAFLGTAHTSTIDYTDEHCLVMDDSEQEQEHPARFRFKGRSPDRPFFGTALLLGNANGNWSSSTLAAEEVSKGIIWEHWDPAGQRYVTVLPAHA